MRCATLTGASRVDESNWLVVRPVCIDGRLNVAIRVQDLPHGKYAIDTGVMQPEDGIESRDFRKLHMSIPPYTVMNDIVDGFNVVRRDPLTTRPGT